MWFVALLQLGTFFACWLGGCALPLLALARAYLSGKTDLALCLIAYYGYRWIVPRGPWSLAQQWMAWVRKHSLYFSEQTMVFEAPLKPNNKHLLCYHPHGILCCGWSLNGCIAPGIVENDVSYLGANALFSLPIISDVLSWYGCGPASKENMTRLMRAGRNCALIPGGFQEATLYRRGRHRVYLKTRAGFIKYALQHGYALTPVYNFGEEQTYWAFSWLQEKFLWLNRFQIPAVFFAGKYGTFLPDWNAHLHTVFGKPLQLPTIEQPSREQVAIWHGKYVDALRALFERHRERYAPGAELEIL